MKAFLRALPLLTILYCLSVTISSGQYAKYQRATRVIEIDFGSASISINDVERIYLNNGPASTIYSSLQVKSGAGGGLRSHIYSVPAPANMPPNLQVSPVQLDILYRPDPKKNDLSVIPVTVEEVGVVVPYATMLAKLEQGLKDADGKDDAELYVSGDVTTALGSKPNWVADVKYEREFAFDKFPFFVAPFANLSYNSKVSETDKLNFGVKLIKTFAYSADDTNIELDRRGQELLTHNTAQKDTANYRVLKKSRAQRQYFQYSGSLQFESDWDFRVNNIITSQELRYLLRPKFFRNSDKRINGKAIFTPFLGAELGRNLKNPLTSTDKGISRMKAGAILTLTSDHPFGGLFGKELVWENTFTQRWLLARENAFDKDDDGKLIFKNFGKKPKSHFKSSLEFKFTDYFGPTLTYEWGEEPPLYSKINHKVKFGLVYSFSRKPIP